eukprot:2662584-Rhodomonas_salina.6
MSVPYMACVASPSTTPHSCGVHSRCRYWTSHRKDVGRYLNEFVDHIENLVAAYRISVLEVA